VRVCACVRVCARVRALVHVPGFLLPRLAQREGVRVRVRVCACARALVHVPGFLLPRLALWCVETRPPVLERTKYVRAPLARPK